MTDLPRHLSTLHAKIHDPGKRDFADYCARADAKVEFCRLVISAWPRIAAVLEAAGGLGFEINTRDGRRLTEALAALEGEGT